VKGVRLANEAVVGTVMKAKQTKARAMRLPLLALAMTAWAPAALELSNLRPRGAAAA